MATTSSTSSTGSASSTSTGSGSSGSGGAGGSSGTVAPRCQSGLCDTTNDGAVCSVAVPGYGASSVGFVIAVAAIVGFLRRKR